MKDTRLVTEINGKTMARFMFFNGSEPHERKTDPLIICTILIRQDNLALDPAAEAALRTVLSGTGPEYLSEEPPL